MTAKRDRTFIQFQIDPTVKTKFTNKVDKEGKKITDVIMRWIEDYVSEEEKVDVVELKHQVESLTIQIEALQHAVQDKNSVLVGESAA